jgi:hypothetical protein
LKTYFYRDNSGKEIGPFDLDTLAKLRLTGMLNDNTSVRAENSTEWKILRDFLPPLSAAPQISRSTKKSANWTWAGLLIAIIIVLIASHASNPNIQHAAEAEQAFRQQSESEQQSEGVKVVSFKATSGQSFLRTNSLGASVVESYKLDFEAEIESERDQTVNGVVIHQGDRAKFAGSMIGSKTESGWKFRGYRFLNFIGDSSMKEANLSGERNVAQANTCINNLRQIDAAINEWALETGKSLGAIPTMADIKPYIKLTADGEIPSCPSGGTYSLHPVGSNPQVTCSIPGHALP